MGLTRWIQGIERSRDRTVWLALRWFLILTIALLLAPPGSGRTPGAYQIALLLAFVLSNVALTFFPSSRIDQRRLEFLAVIADTFLIAVALFSAGLRNSNLPLVFFITLLLSILGASVSRTALAATLTAGLYLYLTWRTSDGAGMTEVLLRLPFLYVSALYYGHIVVKAREEMSRVRRVEREKRDLETLVEVTGATTSTLDLHEVLYIIVRRIALLVRALRCSIITVDEERGLAAVLASSDDPTVNGLALSIDKYPEIRQVMQTRRAVVINDVGAEPSLAPVRARLKALGFESIMVLPLVHGDSLLGMLILRAARAEQVFSEQEIAACQVIANASANALKNAMLYDQTRREAESRRQTAEKLQNILDHFPDLIYTTDLEGRITEFSRGGEAMLGLRRGEMLGRSWEDLYTETEALDRLRRLQSIGETQPAFETTARGRDGSMCEVLVSAAKLNDVHGHVTGTLGIIKNIADLKEAQRHLVQAEKLSAIGEVISGVAHELNNPLAGVLGFAQLLQGGTLEPKQKRSVDRILESALRCQKIVKNLLAFSRRSPSEKEMVCLNRLIEKTIEMKAYQLKVNNINVAKTLDRHLPKTLVDANQIQQVLLNLINNAQHAISQRGLQGTLNLSTSLRGQTILVRVTDDGAGMPPDVLGRIFDPFFTTKPVGEGTGLGLSVSYGIVQDHGGRIWATSTPGSGATVHIELPVRSTERPESPAAKKAAPAPSPRVPPLRVLAVDDEVVLLDLLTDFLERDGHQVETASSGREALSRIQERDFDVLIFDLKMPEMNGQELFERVRERRPELGERVIFASGDTLHPETRRFIKESGRPCVDKPFKLEAMRDAVIHVALAGRGGRPAAAGPA